MLLALTGCTWVPLSDLEKRLSCCDTADSGVAPPGDLELSDRADLGVVFVGAEVAVRLDVANVGDGPITLEASIAADDPGEWSYELAGDTLYPGTTTPLDVVLTPHLSGAKSATITVSGSGSSADVVLTAEAQDDVDGDGVGSVASGGADCDDADPSAYGGAPETWYDGVDEACDGGDDYDQDADGVVFPDDCDDTDASVFPGATETWYDGIDQDCDGASDFDQDGDGFEQGADCDDTNADAGGGSEDWNGRDDDCDGWFDEDLTVGTVAAGFLLGETTAQGLGDAGTLAVADLDDDGLGDVLAASDASTTGVVYAVSAPDALAGSADIAVVAFAAFSGTSNTPVGDLTPPLGDLTGDATTDLIVGGELGRAGAVWVLDGDSASGEGALAAAADLTVTGDSGSDDLHLGAAGDVDGDGVDDLVTGAAYDDYVGAFTLRGAGNVSVFLGPLRAESLDLSAADAQIHGWLEGDSLGASLVLGDWNGDGYTDAAAGAPGDDALAEEGGTVSLFAGASSPAWEGFSDDVAWVQLAGSVAGLQLGAEPIPLPADLDGGAIDDLGLLSASSGDAWLFTDLGALSGEVDVATADATVSLDATALWLGDLDGDGFGDLGVGVAGDDTNGSDAGALAFWHGPLLGRALTTPEAWIYGETAGDRLGSGLTVGELDGDGNADVVAGAPGVDGTSRDVGAVYVITGR